MELSDAPQGGPDTAVRVDRRGSLLLATLDQPAAGMIKNCATTPATTASGREATR